MKPAPLTPLRRLPGLLRTVVACTAAALGCGGVTAAPGHAHEHGVMSLDIVVEPTRLSISMRSPLDNLVGFEQAPRTAAQRAKVAAMVSRLKAAEQLFRIDPAAGCTLNEVRLDAPVLGVRLPETSASAAAPNDGHGDLEADFEFRCTGANPAAHLDLGVWEAFNGLKRIEVQRVTPRGQGRQTLRRPTPRLALR
ncbi:MAG: DUF2796 domain-containing protein [Pseudomonadota bacterium]